MAGLASGLVWAQGGAATVALPAYDVVSIKVNKSGSGSWGIDSGEGHFTATNVSLKNLLQTAYGVKEDLIFGLSGPVESARFDVIAKIVDPDREALKKLTETQERAMLMPFLLDRFGLKTHTETKILPVYELVVLAGGPKFQPSPPDPAHSRGGGTSTRRGMLTAHDISMVVLASALTGQIHRTVIDKTGLLGNYDLGLKWSPDDPTEAQSEFPSIFTAIQEQLGLKLQGAKGPVTTLVVDHAEMPSAN
jgi:uncharacterized protein (TIGR03435 family)